MNVTALRQPEAKRRHSIPSVSVEVSLIVEKIAANRDSAQTFTYDDVSSWIGRNVLENRGYLASARHILFREHGILIETVRKVGVRIATNSGILGAGVRGVDKSRNALRRSKKFFDAVEYASLSDDEKKTYVGHVSAVNTLALLAKPASIRKVAEQGGDGPLPSATVLALFQK